MKAPSHLTGSQLEYCASAILQYLKYGLAAGQAIGGFAGRLFHLASLYRTLSEEAPMGVASRAY